MNSKQFKLALDNTDMIPVNFANYWNEYTPLELKEQTQDPLKTDEK